MSKDLVIAPSGGTLAIPDSSQSQSMSMPGPSTLALRRMQARSSDRTVTQNSESSEPLSSPEHLENFEHALSAVFSAGGGDQQLVETIVEAAKSLDTAVGREGGRSLELPEVVDAFVARLVQAGISDVRTIGKAVAAGVGYLAATEKAAGKPGGSSQRDEADLQKARTALKSHWGANYKANIKTVKDFVNTGLPASLADVIWEGRDVDGRAIANSVETMLWLERFARGGQGGQGGGGTSDELRRELREIQMLMKADPKAYYRDERKQARYRELLELLGA